MPVGVPFSCWLRYVWRSAVLLLRHDHTLAFSIRLAIRAPTLLEKASTLNEEKQGFWAHLQLGQRRSSWAPKSTEAVSCRRYKVQSSRDRVQWQQHTLFSFVPLHHTRTTKCCVLIRLSPDFYWRFLKQPQSADYFARVHMCVCSTPPAHMIWQ